MLNKKEKKDILQKYEKVVNYLKNSINEEYKKEYLQTLKNYRDITQVLGTDLENEYNDIEKKYYLNSIQKSKIKNIELSIEKNISILFTDKNVIEDYIDNLEFNDNFKKFNKNYKNIINGMIEDINNIL